MNEKTHTKGEKFIIFPVEKIKLKAITKDMTVLPFHFRPRILSPYSLAELFLVFLGLTAVQFRYHPDASRATDFALMQPL